MFLGNLGVSADCSFVTVEEPASPYRFPQWQHVHVTSSGVEECPHGAASLGAHDGEFGQRWVLSGQGKSSSTGFRLGNPLSIFTCTDLQSS